MTDDGMLPEDVARRILEAALREHRCAEFLDVLYNGGSAAVDRGRLVFVSGNQLAQMIHDQFVDEQPTVHVHTRQDDGTWVEEDVVLRTRSGRVLTDADIERLAAEAEAGYEIENLRPRHE